MLEQNFLDEFVIQKFRNKLNEIRNLSHETIAREQYNLFCACLDKCDTSINYLKSHSEYPENEAELICFLTFACLVIDVRDSLFRELKLEKESNENYFREVQQSNPFNSKKTVLKS